MRIADSTENQFEIRIYFSNYLVSTFGTAMAASFEKKILFNKRCPFAPVKLKLLSPVPRHMEEWKLFKHRRKVLWLAHRLAE